MWFGEIPPFANARSDALVPSDARSPVADPEATSSAACFRAHDCRTRGVMALHQSSPHRAIPTQKQSSLPVDVVGLRQLQEGYRTLSIGMGGISPNARGVFPRRSGGYFPVDNSACSHRSVDKYSASVRERITVLERGVFPRTTWVVGQPFPARSIRLPDRLQDLVLPPLGGDGLGQLDTCKPKRSRNAKPADIKRKSSRKGGISPHRSGGSTVDKSVAATRTS